MGDGGKGGRWGCRKLLSDKKDDENVHEYDQNSRSQPPTTMLTTRSVQGRGKDNGCWHSLFCICFLYFVFMLCIFG